MKIKFALKDPDGVYESLHQAAKNSTRSLALSAAERDDLIDHRHEQFAAACSKWIRNEEYVTIEIDTDAETATVCTA